METAPRVCNSRLELLDNVLAHEGRCAEIGVAEAVFSVEILRRCRPRELYLIDRWGKVPDLKLRQKKAVCLEEAMERLAPHMLDGVVRPICEYSVAAAAWFPDEYLDFVFIDAEHKLPGPLQDLEAWWPKVRRGGIVAGHDWQLSGPRAAVPAFLKKMGMERLPVRVTVERVASFWMEKP